MTAEVVGMRDGDYVGSLSVPARSQGSSNQLRIIPAGGLHTAQQVSVFLRDEIAELQASGEQSLELVLTVRPLDHHAPVEARAITLRIDGADGSTVIVDGLLKSPVRVPAKKSVVGPVQLLLDEISGTFGSELL
jgi:hypothetical protein